MSLTRENTTLPQGNLRTCGYWSAIRDHRLCERHGHKYHVIPLARRILTGTGTFCGRQGQPMHTHGNTGGRGFHLRREKQHGDGRLYHLAGGVQQPHTEDRGVGGEIKKLSFPLSDGKLKHMQGSWYRFFLQF